MVLAATATIFRPVRPTNESGDAPSARKVKPQSLNFASEDLSGASVPTNASDVAAELVFLHSSMTDLHDKFSIIQKSIHDLLMIASRESNA